MALAVSVSPFETRAQSPLLKELLPAKAVRLYRSTNQISDWIKCMQTRQLPICDVEIGHRTASVCNTSIA